MEQFRTKYIYIKDKDLYEKLKKVKDVKDLITNDVNNPTNLIWVDNSIDKPSVNEYGILITPYDLFRSKYFIVFQELINKIATTRRVKESLTEFMNKLKEGC